jgi:hypothetical protein
LTKPEELPCSSLLPNFRVNYPFLATLANFESEQICLIRISFHRFDAVARVDTPINYEIRTSISE